jgi:hypothetical protein
VEEATMVTSTALAGAFGNAVGVWAWWPAAPTAFASANVCFGILNSISIQSDGSNFYMAKSINIY